MLTDEDQDPLEILKDRELANEKKKKEDKIAEKENKGKASNGKKVVAAKKNGIKESPQPTVNKSQENQSVRKEGNGMFLYKFVCAGLKSSRRNSILNRNISLSVL